MRECLLLALTAGMLQAAVIRGTVVEHQSGKVLARALVVVTPVQGTPGAAISVRTNSYGAFETSALPAGAYLVSVARRGFAPALYGQKRWKAPGIPVVLEEAQSTSLNIRMPRFGSVTGIILDENDVGLPEHDVVIYRNTRPPQLVTRVKTDDRGIYRIAGLEPGRYLVRTVGKQYEEGGYLPTFHKEVAAVEQAYQVELEIDRETSDVNVRPHPGLLFTVAGQALVPLTPPQPALLTLISDTGSESFASDESGNFKFNPTAPGRYELYATAPGDRRGPVGAYMPIELERDRTDIRIGLRTYPQVQFLFQDDKGQPIDPGTVQVLARRKDLSGDGRTETLKLARSAVQLAPGRWDMALGSTPKYYAETFKGPGVDGRQEGMERGRADGWNEVLLPGTQTAAILVTFRLSSSPGQLHGTVTAGGHDAVPGVPVYLEAYDVDARKRLIDVREARTDLHGRYQFYGLAPGNYRILSTFEFQAPDSATMEAASPRTVKIEAGRDTPLDLDLFVIR
jgi:protocatechuate 3,4-dioxygenase beta subunit